MKVLLVCKGCGEEVPKDRKSAILHFKACQKLQQQSRMLVKQVQEKSKEIISLPLQNRVKQRPSMMDNNHDGQLNQIRERGPRPLKDSNQLVKFKKKNSVRKPCKHRVIVYMANAPVPTFYKVGDGRSVPFAAIRCLVCRLRFGNVTKLRQHLRTHRPSKARFTGLITKSFAKLAGKLRHPCSYPGCRRSFRTKAYLHNHEFSHTPTFGNIKAAAIQRWMGQGGKLEFKARWRISLKNQRIFKCPHCRRGWRKFATFKNHLVGGGKCKTRSNRMDRVSRLISTYLKRHHCPEQDCCQKFPSKLHLKCHRRKEHENQHKFSTVAHMLKLRTSLPCPQCPEDKPRRFRSKKLLKNHFTLMHTQYKCPICFEICAGTINLTGHKRLYHKPSIIVDASEGEEDIEAVIAERYSKSHVCPFPGCGMAFTFAKGFKSHLTIHAPKKRPKRKKKLRKRPQKRGRSKIIEPRETDYDRNISEENNNAAWNLLPQIEIKDEELLYNGDDYEDVDDYQDFTQVKMEIKVEEEGFYIQPENDAEDEFIVGI